MLYVGQVVYFELNIDEIIEKYCVNKDKPQLECNGKCHLAKQIAVYDNTTTDDATGIETINIKEIFTLVYLVKHATNVPNSTSSFSSEDATNLYKNNYSYLGTSSFFRPPNTYLI